MGSSDSVFLKLIKERVTRMAIARKCRVKNVYKREARRAGTAP